MLYRFDDFEVDTEKYELRRNGTVRPVEPLVFDLIAFLSRNAGRVLSRDEVIDGVWKGRIVSARVEGVRITLQAESLFTAMRRQGVRAKY